MLQNDILELHVALAKKMLHLFEKSFIAKTLSSAYLTALIALCPLHVIHGCFSIFIDLNL